MKIFTTLLGHPVQNIFFALIKKIFWDPLGPPYQKMKIFTYEVLGKKRVLSSFLMEFFENIQKKIFTVLLGHLVQNNFLMKKIFLQTLAKMIIIYKMIFFKEFWDPLGHPTNKIKNITYEVLGIKIGYEWCVHLRRKFWKIFKHFDFANADLHTLGTHHTQK